MRIPHKTRINFSPRRSSQQKIINMYKLTTRPNKTKMKVNKAYEGESIEQKIDRIVNNKEPISDGAPIIYTERNEGVLPEYNIRADKWDIAIDAMDKVEESNRMKRDIAAGERTYDKMSDEKKNEFNKKYPDNKFAKAAAAEAAKSESVA